MSHLEYGVLFLVCAAACGDSANDLASDAATDTASDAKGVGDASNDGNSGFDAPLDANADASAALKRRGALVDVTILRNGAMSQATARPSARSMAPRKDGKWRASCNLREHEQRVRAKENGLVQQAAERRGRSEAASCEDAEQSQRRARERSHGVQDAHRSAVARRAHSAR